MTTNRCFIDSNVWVYAFAEVDDPRGTIARELIESAPQSSELIISYQVVNETIRVLKKYGHSEQELRQTIAGMFRLCEVSGFTQNCAMFASELREAMSVSYWDSHIAASAIFAGCDTLVSEDFQAGTLIHGMRVKNPFAE
jgi:predicted nucleic acid-binding protein